MAAPTNISAATAQALGDLPASYTQRVDDAGTTYTTWYSFVAPSTGVISAFGYGDASVYTPTTTPWIGPTGAPTNLLSISGGANLTIQFPVTSGTTYFLKVVPNGGNPTPANLTLSVELHTDVAAPLGTIAINDDTDGFPLALLSSTADYTVLRFVTDFPAGEAGDTLIDGTVLVENDNDTVDLYTTNTGSFVLVNQTAITVPKIRTCNGANTFYVGNNVNPATYFTMTRDGTASAPVTLTANGSLAALAAANDESVLYFANTGSGAAIKTWNIPGNVAGANLVAGIASYSVIDILVLGDDSIVVGYQRGSVDYKVLRYSPAGATLNTYTFGSSFTSTVSRLAYAIDDPNSFWVLLHPASTDTGTSKFLNVQVSDGTILTTRLSAEYEDGVYQSAATATPLARFGNSFSCPFWIMRQSIGTVTQTFPIRRQRRCLLPSSPDNKVMRIPYLELLMRTGIGLMPAAWNSTANSPLGANPQVMLRISKDGGKTWLPEQWVSAGEMGRFKDRVRWLRTPNAYRNAVVEITVSDPVDWQFLALMGTPTEGSS